MTRTINRGLKIKPNSFKHHWRILTKLLPIISSVIDEIASKSLSVNAFNSKIHSGGKAMVIFNDKYLMPI